MGTGEYGTKNLNIPVVVSDFAEIRENGYYYVDKTGLIAELCVEHPYLLSSDNVDSYDRSLMERVIHRNASFSTIKNSLLSLTRVMYAYYGKPVILLIDEYDVPVPDIRSIPTRNTAKAAVISSSMTR